VHNFVAASGIQDVYISSLTNFHEISGIHFKKPQDFLRDNPRVLHLHFDIVWLVTEKSSVIFKNVSWIYHANWLGWICRRPDAATKLRTMIRGVNSASSPCVVVWCSVVKRAFIHT